MAVRSVVQLSRRERLDRAKGRADAGVGLVGVIVALVLLAVGVVSLSNVLTQSVVMQTITAQRSAALYIAQTEMEQVRAMDPTTIVAVAALTVDETGATDPGGVFIRSVTVADQGNDLIEVTVIVTGPRIPDTRLVTWIYYGAM